MSNRRCADCGQVYLGSRFDDAKCPDCASTGAMTMLAGAMLLVVCWVVTCGVGVGAYLCVGGKVPIGGPMSRKIGPAYVVGILHPAFIARGNFGKQPLQVHYLRRARRLATVCATPGGLPPRELSPMDPSSPPASALPFPRFLAPRTLADLEAWARGDLTHGVTCDVEAAGDHIRAVGFCRVSDLVPLVVPFRRQGGGGWWKTKEELVGAVGFVDRVLGDPTVPKVFHFGQSYDLPRQLERAGFVVRGYAMDTAFLAHLAFPETPKGLQVQATWRLGMGMWKHLAKGEAEADEKEGVA